jgi:hypothetical protein
MGAFLMISEIVGARFKTVATHRWAANTAGFTADLTDADYLGPCDCLFVAVDGAARTIELNEGGSGLRITIASGRTPVFDIRVYHVVIGSGTSADITLGLCYSDRWGT